MRLAVISDIHGNLEALRSVLGRIDESRCDEIWCLGDIVGYGADPSACIELVRERCSLVVAGNHDTAATRDQIPPGYNSLARQALLWTKARLSSDEVTWLRSLPVTALRFSCLACHGSLRQRDAYVDSDREARINLDLMLAQYPQASILLCGHTHVKAWATRETHWKSFSSGTAFDWPEQGPLLVNPGSIGQPRDGNPRASWALLDLDKRRCELKTTSYEIGLTQEKIIKGGLPIWLAERLDSGT